MRAGPPLERQASKIATRVGAAHMIQSHPTTDFEYRAPQGVWVDYLADSLLPMFNAWRAEHGIYRAMKAWYHPSIA
jgi:hypothetical protein